MRIFRYPDRDALMAAAADQLVRLAAEAVRDRGRFTVALSGGSTPRAVYRLLSARPRAQQVDWANVQCYFGDERCVPPDHPESNYRMAREALFDRVPIPAVNVHRMLGEAPPQEAAAEYERVLRETLPAPAGFGRFDLNLLGLGDDGHTASLFPGLKAVHEQQRWVAAERVDKAGMWRITLTPPVINASAVVSFLVAGEAKAAMLARVVEGPIDIDERPAQVVRPASGELFWLIDAAAGSQLQRGRIVDATAGPPTGGEHA